MNEITRQSFDENDPKYVGFPAFFNLDQFLSIVEQLVVSDETEKALMFLDNMPSWYQEYPSEQAQILKNHILKKLSTPVDYADYLAHVEETKNIINADPEQVDKLLLSGLTRGLIVKNRVKELNDKGIVPHIHEVAPGSYWLPIGLKKCGFKFKYYSRGLNQDQDKLVREYLDENWLEGLGYSHCIFICFELIEHLHEPKEIYQHYLKSENIYSEIFLSTPLHCIFGGNTDWQNGEIGHLRTYSPQMFAEFAVKYWPDFTWQLHKYGVMVLQGTRS